MRTRWMIVCVAVGVLAVLLFRMPRHTSGEALHPIGSVEKQLPSQAPQPPRTNSNVQQSGTVAPTDLVHEILDNTMPIDGSDHERLMKTSVFALKFNDMLLSYGLHLSKSDEELAKADYIRFRERKVVLATMIADISHPADHISELTLPPHQTEEVALENAFKESISNDLGADIAARIILAEQNGNQDKFTSQFKQQITVDTKNPEAAPGEIFISQRMFSSADGSVVGNRVSHVSLDGLKSSSDYAYLIPYLPK